MHRLLMAFSVLLVMVSTATAQMTTASVGTNCTASWTAPTTNTDGSAITGTLTYNLYFQLQSVATPPVVGTTPPSLTGITTTSVAACKGLAAGKYNAWVTAVEKFSGSTSESALSASFPFSLVLPVTPTSLSVQ